MIENANKWCWFCALIFGAAAMSGCLNAKEHGENNKFNYSLYTKEDLKSFACGSGKRVDALQLLLSSLDEVGERLRQWNESILTPVSWEEPTVIGYRQGDSSEELQLIYTEFDESKNKLFLDDVSLAVTFAPCDSRLLSATYLNSR